MESLENRVKQLEKDFKHMNDVWNERAAYWVIIVALISTVIPVIAG